MATEPNVYDAWLLAALLIGKGDPVQTLAAADHMMIMYPSPQEWAHACAVLGERGLIADGDPLPRPTELAEKVASPFFNLYLPRKWSEPLRAEIATLPTNGSQVKPPDPDVMARAIETLNEVLHRYFDNPK